MSFLTLRAYLKLIQTELLLAHSDFAVLHRKVRNYPVANCKSACDGVDKVCAAVDIACIWYWKQVLCLQRGFGLRVKSAPGHRARAGAAGVAQ